jgi:parvulin-like peptidyl-prolyl isomerase
MLLLLVAVCTAACSGSNANADIPTVPTTSANVQSVSSEGLPLNSAGIAIVAKINGREITLPEFQRALARRQLQIEAADPQALASDVLDTMIEQTLIEQAAESLNISVSEADVDVAVNDLRQTAGSDEAWQQWLTANLYTEAEIRSDQRNGLITQQVVSAVTQNISDNVKVVHARHILVPTEAQAADLLARIQAGADFADLAQQYSTDVTSKDTGGDLGWFTEYDLLEPVLAQVAFSLLPGQVAGPVATRLGYHVIQALEFSEQPVTAEQRAVLTQKQFENWLQSLLDSATIERFGEF